MKVGLLATGTCEPGQDGNGAALSRLSRVPGNYLAGANCPGNAGWQPSRKGCAVVVCFTIPPPIKASERHSNLFVKPQLFRPDFYYTAFWNIDFKKLSKMGIDYLIIDLDSTIASAHSKVVDERVKAALEKAFDSGYIKNACLVSNIMYGKRKHKRLSDMAQGLGIPYIAAYFYRAKPRSAPFLKGLKKLNSTVKNTAVVGDQIFTDILGGNKLGMTTILLKPLGTSHWSTLISLRRLREKLLIKSMGLKLSDGQES